MGTLNDEKAALEARLIEGAQPPAQLAEDGRRLKQLGEEVEQLEERWLELSTELEGLVGS